jgi:hypothetical protein
MLKRTPANYTEHVNEFKRLFGNYQFEIADLWPQRQSVCEMETNRKTDSRNRWLERTQFPLIEYTSAVYRIENNKIVEYWIEMDLLGFDLQLKANKELANPIWMSNVRVWILPDSFFR